jgi:hypothetical protein
VTLSASEIESVRFHLGFGNLNTGAVLFTRDGFLEFFSQVVSVYLSTATETSATTAITAGASTTVTPLVMTDIVAGAQLVVDVADACELVSVRSVTATTFTAAFAIAHPASGYPVMLMSGKARLRYLLGAADRLWQKLQSASVGGTLGIKQLGQGEIEWFGPKSVYDGLMTQYRGVVDQMSSLIRVPDDSGGGSGNRVAVY